MVSTRDEIPQIVERVMRREQPELWDDLPDQLKTLVIERVQEQLPATVQSLTEEIGEYLEDPITYQVLEAQPYVLEAVRRASRARTVQRSIRLTPFGGDFCEICLPLEGIRTGVRGLLAESERGVLNPSAASSIPAAYPRPCPNTALGSYPSNRTLRANGISVLTITQ